MTDAPIVETPPIIVQLPFFVYGTLLHGMWNYNTRVRGKTIDEQVAWLPNCQLRGHSIAKLWAGGEFDTVRGNLLWIDPDKYNDVLDLLDTLEGYHEDNPSISSYNRIRIYAHHHNEQREVIQTLAWVYAGGERMASSADPIIPNGDYMKHMVRIGR